MELESQAHVSKNVDPTVRNGGVSGKIEAFNGLAEGNNFSHLFNSNQLNRGHNRNLSASKMSELMKLGNLESASTQSLFSVVKTILDESFEKKNEDIPQRVTSLLKLVVQEIEHRFSKHSDDMKKQNNLCKSREDSIQSKIRALETLASGATEENEVVMKQLQQMKTEKAKMEELENFSESKYSQRRRKEHGLNHFIDSQSQSLQELRLASESIKKEVLKMKNVYMDEFYQLGRIICESGINLEGFAYAAKDKDNCKVIEENRKLYNEVQDLKGNIRIYCRVRPFLNEQSENQTTIKYIGENGEVAIQNPSKPSKDSPRIFKFNKVFAPAATQEEVFLDTQPLIKSVLDGYNVCIFAYGQTGSGKTYTMIGPNAASAVNWGVNYRALNDLFNISQNRCSSINYEIGVQMVEIYNEQVRDLLRSDHLQKRLGIWNITQPNGLVVPDANMYPVNSTKDVIDLMNIGLTNRVVGATSLNERSSRSHSILTVHVRGTELETNAVLRGCLHLVDLAGSERVDRSEATGNRLRESQYINKSLSALGDVIFALSQKSSHVPYRNSKLTQILQSSLGGQAKTLMFVHLNPDVQSYSETASTLKFAERVAGVELGAARSNKEGKGVRELMEQVASLKNSVAKKDEEIDRLRMLKTNGNNEKRDMNSPKKHPTGSPRPIQGLSGGKTSSEKAISDFDNSSEYSEKQSEVDSQQSSNDEFKHHKEFFKQSRLVALSGGQNVVKHKGVKFALTEDTELLGFGGVESEERLSDISDGDLSMGTETDGSSCCIVEYTLFPEVASSSAEITEKQNLPIRSPRTPTKKGQAGSSQTLLSKGSSKIQSPNRATATTQALLHSNLPKNRSNSHATTTATPTFRKK